MQNFHKTILITGAGSGLGEAIARHYAKLGWRLGITDMHLSRAQTVLDSIQAAGGQGFAAELDTTNEDHWQEAKSLVSSNWGGLDILVNNAGVAVAGNMEETPMDDWRWVLDIDLMGVVRGCHHFAGQFKQQRRGHVVNVASFAAFAGTGDIVAYGTAKAGVVALSESLRMEMAPFGVGVSVVCPAFVKTNLTETMRAPDPRVMKRVDRWMENSGVSAEAVARQLYSAVVSNRFLVLTHGNTRWLWRLKRYLPGIYYRLLLKKGHSGTRK